MFYDKNQTPITKFTALKFTPDPSNPEYAGHNVPMRTVYGYAWIKHGRLVLVDNRGEFIKIGGLLIGWHANSQCYELEVMGGEYYA